MPKLIQEDVCRLPRHHVTPEPKRCPWALGRGSEAGGAHMGQAGVLGGIWRGSTGLKCLWDWEAPVESLSASPRSQDACEVPRVPMESGGVSTG